MKKLFTLFCLVFGATHAFAQFTESDIRYWIGSGPDTAILAVDFRDGTADSSYAWGFLFDETDNLTFNDLLQAVDDQEPQFHFVQSGGYLNDIYFNAHSGLANSPDWWSTWSGDDLSGLTMNSGISESLVNGRWYGCSYGFTPSAVQPSVVYAAYSSEWFNMDDVTFWTGSGTDSAILVVDFVPAPFGDPGVYAWGVKFNGTITGEEMLAQVAAADPNFQPATGGGFLNDIVYNANAGIAASPYYWGTFSATNMSDWTLNAGLSTTVSDGGWFGCSYAEWEPRRPFIPVPANDPNAFVAEDVLTWVGQGSDSAVIVFDFNDNGAPESFAFGYLFNGSATATDALTELGNTVPGLSLDLGGGFLNDIVYGSHSGIGGTNGNYWSTWSGQNNGNWSLNAGITENLSDGSWFACSFTNYDPALPPNTPVAAPNTLSVDPLSTNSVEVYPNPTNGFVTVKNASGCEIQLLNMQGQLVQQQSVSGAQQLLDLTELPAGVYLMNVHAGEKKIQTIRIVRF